MIDGNVTASVELPLEPTSAKNSSPRPAYGTFSSPPPPHRKTIIGLNPLSPSRPVLSAYSESPHIPKNSPKTKKNKTYKFINTISKHIQDKNSSKKDLVLASTQNGPLSKKRKMTHSSPTLDIINNNSAKPLPTPNVENDAIDGIDSKSQHTHNTSTKAIKNSNVSKSSIFPKLKQSY